MTAHHYVSDAPGAAPSMASASADAVRPLGVVNLVGAGCSLALVAGLIIWGVQLTLRDVAEVPVIAALKEPMRVAPDDPGGIQAAYQGLAVNEIKAGGAAAPVPDQVILAPPPVALDAARDVVLTAASFPQVEPEATATPAAYSALDVSDLQHEIENADLSAVDAPVVETAALGRIPVSVPGVVRSSRPLERPDGLQVTRAVAMAAPAQSVDADPDNVPAGARLVQLGAFDSPEQARRAWDQLNERFGDYLSGKQRLVQSAVSGGRNFYRLRVVGFSDGADAQRFCSAFLARNAACIPVRAK